MQIAKFPVSRNAILPVVPSIPAANKTTSKLGTIWQSFCKAPTDQRAMCRGICLLVSRMSGMAAKNSSGVRFALFRLAINEWIKTHKAQNITFAKTLKS
jgi:hypothetical protein